MERKANYEMSEAIFEVATTMSIRPGARKSKRGEKLIKFIKINQRNWVFWTCSFVWAIWRRGTSEWVISQFTPLMNLCHDFSLNFHVTTTMAALPQSQHNFSILILISFLHSILLFHYITLHTMSGVQSRLKEGESNQSQQVKTPVNITTQQLPLLCCLSEINDLFCCCDLLFSLSQDI